MAEDGNNFKKMPLKVLLGSVFLPSGLKKELLVLATLLER